VEAEILKAFPELNVELIRGGKGIFDIKSNTEVIFSKYAERRFPKPGEVAARLAPRISSS
jgi:hypothetical protein